MYFAEYMRFIYYRGGCYVERRSNKDTVGLRHIGYIFKRQSSNPLQQCVIAQTAWAEDFMTVMWLNINLSKIPTKKTKGITDAPLIWRYFESIQQDV